MTTRRQYYDALCTLNFEVRGRAVITARINERFVSFEKLYGQPKGGQP
jgi:hypothetical protein